MLFWLCVLPMVLFVGEVVAADFEKDDLTAIREYILAHSNLREVKSKSITEEDVEVAVFSDFNFTARFLVFNRSNDHRKLQEFCSAQIEPQDSRILFGGDKFTCDYSTQCAESLADGDCVRHAIIDRIIDSNARRSPGDAYLRSEAFRERILNMNYTFDVLHMHKYVYEPVVRQYSGCFTYQVTIYMFNGKPIKLFNSQRCIEL